MTPVTSISGHASLSPAGKRRVGLSMYVKGKAFVGAYFLLRRQADSEAVDFVALHNLCQGIEVTLKGLLLLRDYDRFAPQLRRLGHNLNAVVSESLVAYGLKPLTAALAQELTELSNLYAQHLLRYGSAYDILVDSRTIRRTLVVRRMEALIRLVEREL